MSDLTPPPERQLDEATKQRMRAELTAATAAPYRSSRARGWLVPAVAAAAVAAVIAGGSLMLSGNDGGARTLAPGGSDTSASSTPSSPTSQPATPDPSCARAVKEFLPGADMKYSQKVDGAGKVTTDVELWVDGDQWQVCDTFATLDDPAGQETPTLFAVQQGRRVNQERLRISMNFVQVGGGLQAEYVAAGRASAEVAGIRYTFPDGHVEDVTPAAHDGYWSMVYLPESGPLADGDLRGVDPIKVTVFPVIGEQQSYTLEWGVDTCAQINHGC
jgi:hypothetical protein